jgi:biotin operon repressor
MEDEITGQMAALLKEARVTNELLRVLVAAPLRERVVDATSGASELRGLQMSDGSRSVREVAREVGVSSAAVGKWWKKWRVSGIAVLDEDGHVRHIVAPRDLGVTIEGG